MVTVSTGLPTRVDRIPGGARLRGWWRPAALIASIAAAYALPLSMLVRATGYDTPLAYLGLVPPLAFVLGCWRHHRHAAAPASPTPRDAVAGGALLVLAALIAGGAPVLLTPSPWSQGFDLAAFPRFAAGAHLDLLSLPLFAAGMLVLLYGATALRWAWPALGYAFLVWPVPYTFLLGHLLPFVADATAWATGGLSAVLPLGATVSPEDGTLFTIATPHGPQAVSIGSACSGFNSFVAWLLLAGAGCIIVRERRGGGSGLRAVGRLALWVLAGAIGALLGNIVRIALLFAIVHRSGLDATFDRVHASLGNGLFTLIVLGMVALLPRFGLALPQPTRAARDRPVLSPGIVLPPVQASLLACAALALATGMLLGVGILHLALALLGGYLLLALYLLAIGARPHGMNDQHPRRRAIILALAATVVAAGALALAWSLKEARSAQLPSMGWRIDQAQQGLITGRARHVGAFALAAATLAAGWSARVALRRSAVPARIPGGRRFPAWGGAALAAGAIVVGTASLGVTTVTVASFKENVAAIATAPAADFDAAMPALSDAQPTFVEAYDWPKQSLGKSATYNRYRYDGADGQPLWVDVLTTEDADALAYHSVRTCYAFHGFTERGTLALALGGGATTAGIINYIKPDVNEAWSTLYWEGTIARDGRTFYQRVVLLYHLDLPVGDATGARFGPNNVLMQGYAAQILDRLDAR